MRNVSSAPLSDNIEAYEEMQHDLECDHTGEWVVVHNRQLIGLYPDLEAAADVATERFGIGPYLIRQVGIPNPDLASSVLHRVFS